MDEIEQMEQQPIATESVFANVEPMSDSTSAVEAAAAAVVSLSNNANQQQVPQQEIREQEIREQEISQQELVQQALQEAEVIEENPTVTAVTAPAEFDPASANLPISTTPLQLNSSLPISANLEVTSTLTSTPVSTSLQVHPTSTSMVAVTDITGTPIKVDHDIQPQSQSYDETKDWLVTQQEGEQETVVVPAPVQKLSRRRYSVDFKLLAVDYTKTHSKNETARHFKVHKKQIQEWCKHKDDLIAMKNIVDSGGKVTRGQGRKSLFRSNAGLRPYSIAIDNAVRDYFVDCSKAGLKVTKRMLQEKAYELHQSRTDGNTNFTGSDGWLTKFVQRHGINLKEGTIENPGEMFTSDPDASQNSVGSTGNDIVGVTASGLEMAADASTGYDDSASLDIVKVDTEETTASTDQMMETVEQGTEISTSVLDDSSSATSTPLRPKRKQYSIEEKEYIANHARVEGVSQTVFKFGIPEETIRHWMKIDFDQYKEWKSQVKKKGAPKRKNAPGAGRPLKYPREVDCELRDWILQQQSENNPVSEQALREKAQEMIEPHCPTFKHSSSWLKSFMQRHKLNESAVEGTEVYMGEAGQDMYIDTIDDTYVATDVQSVASQYVTASGVTLLIRQNTEQGDTYDEIALKEYSMDALKAVISVRLGIPEDSIAGLLKEKHRKDGNAVWVRVSTDEDVMRLQDDDLITIVTNTANNP